MTMTTPFRETVSQLPPPKTENAWLRDLQQTATARFHHLGFPTRKHEDWRYINLSPILEGTFPSTRQPTLTVEHQKTPGLTVMPLSLALKESPKLVQSALVADSEEPNAFALLNSALFEEGAFIHVAAGTMLPHPIEVTIETRQAGVTHPRVIVFIENGAHADLRITQITSTSERSFNNAVIDVAVGDQAQFNFILLQRLSEKAMQFSAVRMRHGADCKTTFTSFTHGGLLTRNDVIATFLGERTECHLKGLGLLNAESQLHQHVTTHHIAPRCVSRQLYKNILSGEARAEFNSLAYIHRGAVLSDSGQLSRSMVLSPKARAITRPQLKVFCDDVKGAHGATVGQVSPEELFYLQSRGISKADARGLLIYGFAEEIVEGIAHPLLRQHVEKCVKQDLPEVVRNEA
ncbi:MAG: Fe-S cluster assembly protein SufD [Deltaproteobacteria bacterium]|nr:Fe-S cluster assembly protein SufD [Deltaproteobacteria bacterium]